MGRGEPLLADEPQTIGELFRRVGRMNAQKALTFKRDGRWQSISSSEMLRRAENIALGLFAKGLQKGETAGIIAANSPEWTLTDAACQFAGVVNVPIYTTLAPDAVRYIACDARIKFFFIEDLAAYERLAEILPHCDSIETVVLFSDETPPQGALNLSAVESAGEKLRAERPELIDEMMAAIKPNEVATMLYTSGTTGEPKGVMLTHENIVSNTIDAAEKYDFSAGDIPLSVLPLSHIFERTAMYVYLLNGMSVHFAESVDKAAENLREVRPTIFIGVPRIFEKVYATAKLQAGRSGRAKEQVFDWAIDVARSYALAAENGEAISVLLKMKHTIADRLVYSKFRDFFGGRLRACITGGAALSDDIYLIFTGAGVPIMQGYGLTETSPVVSSNNWTAMKLGTVGRPIRNVKVRIADDGEIEVYGPGVMYGYYNREGANDEAFTADGWFRTGDIGSICRDGFLRITDRKKELFKTSGGKYIAPSLIEQMIRSSRFVNQAVLIGNDRRFPSALIVPNFDQLADYVSHKGLDGLETPEKMIADARIKDLLERQVAETTAKLSKFEKVKKITLLAKEFSVEGGEMTPTLKIKRRVIDEKYAAEIEKMYAE